MFSNLQGRRADPTELRVAEQEQRWKEGGRPETD
jgi:hypothetical protein